MIFFTIVGIITISFLIALILFNFVFGIYKKLKHRNKKSVKEVIDEENDIISFFVRFYIESIYRDIKKPYTFFRDHFFLLYFTLSQHILINTFSAGFCWQFAHMLKATFGRGEVCWAVPYSHFVWVDSDNQAYDCYGKDNPSTSMYYIPESFIPDNLMMQYKKSNNHKGAKYDRGTVDDWFGIVKYYVKRKHPNFIYDDQFIKDILKDIMPLNSEKNIFIFKKDGINLIVKQNENKTDRVVFNVFKPEDKFCYEQFLQQ